MFSDIFYVRILTLGKLVCVDYFANFIAVFSLDPLTSLTPEISYSVVIFLPPLQRPEVLM